MPTRKRKYEYTEKWVECLNCSTERVIEYAIDERDTEGCPVCGSHEYDDSTMQINDWGE